ncbi:DUF190 domain-containing protein [Leeia sp. TBRC 13508]|uniref:DUF190 domain-containing protein n=1 Tax=Leeia speluncae TaxID=2884804 RepID=A0ABS8D9R3_9NEIS|nr:DUF190 domain-containing protein [Leeia speluncae]MCB6184887.1 DUF190 domain-containing protein [Leeia speluncae]
MQGYQLNFYTQQDRTHANQPLAQWIVETAKGLGLRGATLVGGIEGMGHDGKIHAINLFDVSDQPIIVTLIVTDEECDRLFQRLTEEKVNVFYTKFEVTFGTLCAKE